MAEKMCASGCSKDNSRYKERSVRERERCEL